MKKIFATLLIVFSVCLVCAQTITLNKLRDGDLLFGHADCGSLCQAIISVTPSFHDIPLSHVGIFLVVDNTPMVIEAIGIGVVITPLDSFVIRMRNNILVGQLAKSKPQMRAKAIDFALQQVGLPYDDEFLLDNGKYYCSELVYDAYLFANKHKPFFTLKPMTYKNKHSEEYNAEWVQYFKNINAEIPEGLPGCNPGGLSLSHHLKIYQLIN